MKTSEILKAIIPLLILVITIQFFAFPTVEATNAGDNKESCNEKGFPPTIVKGKGYAVSTLGDGKATLGDLGGWLCVNTIDNKKREELKKEAIGKCEKEIKKGIVKNYGKCSTICENQKPQCSTKYTSEIKNECTANCEYFSYGPLASFCGLINSIECTAEGSAETECNCENFVK